MFCEAVVDRVFMRIHSVLKISPNDLDFDIGFVKLPSPAGETFYSILLIVPENFMTQRCTEV